MSEEQNKQPEENKVQAQVPAAEKKDSTKMWAMFTHLSALASLVIWIPGANVLGPLVLWLIKKSEIPAVDVAGKEAINFQIWMTIYTVVSIVSVVGVMLIPVIGIVNLIFVIIASVKTNKGEGFSYPLVPYKFLK